MARMAGDRRVAGRAGRGGAPAAAGAGQRAGRATGPRSPPAPRSPAAVDAAEAELGDDRPGAAAPVGHRAAGPGHGRGADPGAGRRGRRRASPRSSPRVAEQPALGPDAAGRRSADRVGRRCRYSGGNVRHRGVRRSAARAGRRRSRACAGWSTAATTRPASPSSATASCRSRRRPASWRNLEKALGRARRRPDRHAPASGTPGGPPTARPTDRNAHPHLSTPTGAVAVIHNGIIENFARAARRAARRAGVELRQRHRHRGRRAPARPRRYADGAGGDAGRGACARSAAGSRARSRWSSPHADEPGRWSSPPAATRRWWSASATARCFLASDVAAFIAHTREARRARPGPGRRDHRRTATRSPTSHGDAGRAARRSTSTGTSPPPRRAATTTSCSRRSHEQPEAVADTLLRPASSTAGSCSTSSGSTDAGAARHRQGLRRRLRHRLPRRADRQVRHRALDPDPGRGRDGQRVPLPRPGARPHDAGRRDQPVRRDRGHAGGGPARAGAEGPGAGDLQHQRRADPARVRRRALHPRRPGDRRRRRPRRSSPRSPRATWSGWRWPRRAAPSTATRSPASSTRSRRCRTLSPQALGVIEPVRELAREHRRRQGGAVPRPARRLPGGARGCAQAQGAGLHARRGLRRPASSSTARSR